MAYDIGGRGDKSFNDSAAAGLDKAKADLGVPRPRSSRPAPARPSRPARSGCSCWPRAGFNPIIAVGFVYAPALAKVAAEVPGHQVRHHRRDRRDAADNVANLVFAEEQGSFLVGAAAGAEEPRRARSASSAASRPP